VKKVSPLPFDWKSNYYENQLFMTLETSLYDIHIKTNFHVNVSGNTTKKRPQMLEWKIPKISMSVLYEFMIMAAYIYRTMKAECAAVFAYNLQSNKYNVVYPEQEVSGASVKYDNDIQLDQNLTMVADIHSHHDMKISFSGTDDKSDNMLGQLPHISMVFKNVSSVNMLKLDQNVDCRLTIQGNSYPLQFSDCFVNDFMFCNKSFVEKTFYVPKPIHIQTPYSPVVNSQLPLFQKDDFFDLEDEINEAPHARQYPHYMQKYT